MLTKNVLDVYGDIWVGYVRAGTHTVNHKKRRMHGLVMLDTGCKRFDFNDGISLPIRPGEVGYLPQDSTYTVSDIDHGGCYFFNFYTATELTCPPQQWMVNDPESLLAICKTAAKMVDGNDGSYQYKIRSLFYEFLFTLKSQTVPQPSERRFLTIQPAIDWLNRHYCDPDIYITSLANMCDVSDTYFRRIFTERYGITPQKYIHQKRMELAKKMLDSRMYSVTQVSESCGFSDLCIFSRAYKAYFGHAPRVDGGLDPVSFR
ncbi:MAG: helix-turn-helix transcriptional regulator [Ruminococcaceae bacterium]|nr:helix-turn-helix transcriptional regulator [Oscillospiraceae bacterium]